jgi:hypothetical protein
MNSDSQIVEVIKPELVKIVPEGNWEKPGPDTPAKPPEPSHKTEPFGQILIIAVCVVIGAAFFVHVLSSTNSSSPYSKLDLSQKSTPSPTGQVAGDSSVAGPPKRPSVSPTPQATTAPTAAPTANPTPTNTPTPTTKIFPTDTPTPVVTTDPDPTATPSAND